MEHPFFVYGQGWASCNPEGSMQAFGLKCQRLQVGDVCISLKPREQKSPPLSPMQKRSREMYTHQQPQQQQQQQQLAKEHQDLMPQNLSRRSTTTIPTTATDTAVSSQIGPYSPSLYNLQMSLFAAASQGRMPAAYASFLNQDDLQNAAAAVTSGHLQTHDLNTSLNNNNNNNNNNSPDKLPIISKNNDDYGDDLQSRKRRWSAPDIDSEEQQQPRKISN
jgi:Ataxin-1 and HBP1 module (AXH)